MDTNFLSALMMLNGKKTFGSNINRIGRVMNAFNQAKKGGMNQQSLFLLLCEINPNLKPVMTVFNKLNSSQAAKNCACDKRCDGAPQNIFDTKQGSVCASPNMQQYQNIFDTLNRQANTQSCQASEPQGCKTCEPQYSQPFIQYNNFKK
ncbi:MAG: hypothetical protein EOM87_05520 [Clostridia bacterium]|nr:hypothetical protein [Clostridia bacterium]